MVPVFAMKTTQLRIARCPFIKYPQFPGNLIQDTFRLRSVIYIPRKLAKSLYISTELHTCYQTFTFQCIDQIQTDTSENRIEKLLITKEAFWSAQLFSLSLFGLNKRQEFHLINRIPIILNSSGLSTLRCDFLQLHC